MKYDPHKWNVMHERRDLLRCPFCGHLSNEEQRGNLEREFRIRCGNPHCDVQPSSWPRYDLSEAVEGWQIRPETRMV